MYENRGWPYSPLTLKQKNYESYKFVTFSQFPPNQPLYNKKCRILYLSRPLNIYNLSFIV